MTGNYLKELFGNYLYHSYIYYRLGESLIEDTQYDLTCKILLDNYNNFEHRYKYLITQDDLAAGTGFGIDYPFELINYYETRFNGDKV